MSTPPDLLVMGGRLAHTVVDVTHDPAALDGSGFWAVVVTFEGEVTCARFAEVVDAPAWSTLAGRPWVGPPRATWTSSMDEAAYTSGVEAIRARIALGDVYQANLCRVMSARLEGEHDIAALAAVLAEGNPAPYSGVVRLPGVEIATASPETFLRRRGDRVESRPIKGTGVTEADLTDKDRAENVMIVDLVRNDLSRTTLPGTVTVPELCVVEQHPGLVHLVSTVDSRLEPGAGWADLLAVTTPPGSVSGAPKSTALEIIGELEPVPRGPYCGAIGWVDADRREGDLAVGIRTFWRVGDELRFGTGAGITWRSDPQSEWAETQLKAQRLVGLASLG
ncbi:chorismate-binding protein [Acidothermaceae bacterium B102]|nr:chorismate-binding protein [Acidothermaceae bacterium B102]